ncbi:MAG: flavin reductase [Firmicutes bacterium]|nr:flavin reductase [Bacillota bacterium]
MKQVMGPSDTFFPTPVVLVGSGAGEATNIITVAWVGMVCSEPPTIAISMTKGRESTKIIRSHGEFTVNIPNVGLVREVDYCGIVSGRNSNKFRDTNLTPVPGVKINAPIIQECPYNLECKVIQEQELGDFVIFFGEIVEIHIDDTCIGNNGKINLEKVEPLVYAAGLREYWNLGSQVGQAFYEGKKLLAKGM